MWCHAKSDEVRNMVMWCGMMVWCMGNMVVCRYARCEMWLWNTEWCGMVWRHIRHGVMWNDGWNAVWDGCCGIERCVIYIWKWLCAWRGMRWNVDTTWNGVPRCGGVIWCESWCMWNVVRCGISVAISDMAWCGMWLKCKMCDVE